MDDNILRLRIDAENGDEEAQFSLGQHYINAAQTDISPNSENAKLAIKWLISASRQGSIAATALLEECRYKGLGVDEYNAEDVEWCIATPQYEKIAREAARRLFRTLHPLHSERISKDDFKVAVAEITNSKSEKKLLEKAGFKGDSNDSITETDFIDRIIRRLQGHGTSLVSGVENEADWDTFKEATILKKVRNYPAKTLSWLLEATVETAGTQGALWLRSLIPVNQIYAIVAVLLYSVVSIDAFLWALPLLSFYLSFAVMIVSTAQMLRSRRRLGDVRTLAEVLSRFADSFDAESAASAYSWKSLKPYATFFVALPICVGSLNAADNAWILSPEFSALSTIAAVTCFFALADSYDYLAFLSVMFDAVSTLLPSIIRLLPEIPVLHTILWYSLGPGVSVSLPLQDLQLMIGLPSFAFLVVPVIFVCMAARRSWRGTYQILVPHLICFFWWRLAIAFLLRSSWVGLTRALIGWVGFIVLLPVLPIILLFYIGYVLYYATSFPNVLKVLTTVVLVVGASAYAMWSRSGFRVGSWFNLDGKSPLSRAILILAILVASCLPLAYIFAPPSDVTHDSARSLRFEMYRRYCLPPDASLTSCLHYSGARISASGAVTRIAITKVENPTEAVAAWLPSPAAAWLRCAYGAPYPSNCEKLPNEAERDACSFNIARGRSCHLRDLDHYTYELSVSVPTETGDTAIRLLASDWFRGPANYTKVGSQVSFTGTLSDGTAGSTPALSLVGFNCTSCDVAPDDSSVYQYRGSWRALVLVIRAVHAVWNFFLSPLIIFA